MARSPFGYEEKEGEVLAPSYKLIKSKTVELNQIVKPWFNNGKGEVVGRRYDKERMLNNAAALQHISKRTTIPVPRLIGFGVNADGTAWIEMERRVPDADRQEARRRGECAECDRIAKANARRFVTDEVLPQLRSLISDTGGLNVVVIPPLIMMHADTLHVLKIVDWENGGYFPPKFLNVWSLERSDYEEYYANGER
ncbi:hypothetical protein N657DRAFT_636826 [Parathielavia appendiculata]|uniref:Aminoglycoside phosphotransferase domain-containing protein n=1 Tax=Parathielavia appendiculata TaxID=2587402 RepID=A0AAN6TTV9_9PEZI|nr:hypothetical protein N657DRAFT_636826 [Parathielavia appendiculata]